MKVDDVRGNPCGIHCFNRGVDRRNASGVFLASYSSKNVGRTL